MARLIDADALWRKFERMPWYDNADLDEIALPLVDDAPAVDAVEVVRCRDCAVPHNKYTGCQKLNGLVTTPGFYCPFGKRKDCDWNG